MSSTYLVYLTSLLVVAHIVVSVPVEYKRSAPVEYKRSAPVEYKRSAPVEYKRSAPVEYKRSAPVEYKRSAPIEYKRSAPVEYKRDVSGVQHQSEMNYLALVSDQIQQVKAAPLHRYRRSYPMMNLWRDTHFGRGHRGNKKHDRRRRNRHHHRRHHQYRYGGGQLARS